MAVTLERTIQGAHAENTQANGSRDPKSVPGTRGQETQVGGSKALAQGRPGGTPHLLPAARAPRPRPDPTAGKAAPAACHSSRLAEGLCR